MIKKYKRQQCTFISGTDIVPRAWNNWFWELIGENAPFSWGNNNHSLVTARDFADHCSIRLDDSARFKRWLKKLRRLGDTYIDLES